MVTDRTACHQIASACGSKNAAITRDGAARIRREVSNPGGRCALPPDMKEGGTYFAGFLSV
jgi:hypothetical protein